MSDTVTRTIKAGINEYLFLIEPVRDEILNELYYTVSYLGQTFIMRYDFDELQFKIEGVAPDIAHILENELGYMLESLEM